MASVAGTVGATYEALATGRIAEIKTMMDSVITAELTFMVPVLKAAFLIFVGRQALLIMLGHLSVERFVSSTIRVLIVILLITHSGQFVHYVREPIFDTIPNAISSTILASAGVNTSGTASLAQQFDKVAMASDAITAKILALNTGWSVASAANYITAGFANGAVQWLLMLICGVWLLGQTFLAIILCFGPLLLVFELFDRTRGWVDQWIGKLVGLLSFGVGTSILLALQMNGLFLLFKRMETAMPTSGAEAVAGFLRVGGNVFLDALTMASLPLICAIGSGVAASLAAPSALLAARSIGMAGGGASAIASRARLPRRGSPSNALSRT